MTRNTRKNRHTLLSFTLLAASAGVLPILPAHAGYDAATGRATGSYDSNTRGTTRVTRTDTTRRMVNGQPVYGSYSRSVRTTVDTLATGSTLTVTGTLIEDADDKNFAIRDAWGQTWNVQTSRVVNAEATNKLVKGQSVRVYGTWQEGKIEATNVRDLGTGVAFGTRVQYGTRYYVIGEMTTLQGVLVSDADDDEFEIRDRNGVITMVRTHLIPDALGANKLQKGQIVRVSGYWIAEADGVQPQIEAMNLRLM
jgi:uncharacterized protein YdeI (BOF family)